MKKPSTSHKGGAPTAPSSFDLKEDEKTSSSVNPVCSICADTGQVWHEGIPGITNPRFMSCSCRSKLTDWTITTTHGTSDGVFTVPPKK